MSKAKKLHIASLIPLVITVIFAVLTVFIQIREGDDIYILATRIFSSGISALFFYLSFSLSLITLTLSIIALKSDNYILKRISLLTKIYFVIILMTPFFTSIYYMFSHESQFFVFNLLAIYFLILSLILELASIHNFEESIPSDKLVVEYKKVINIDYMLLIAVGLIIIVSCFIQGDFYVFYDTYLTIIPIYFIPVLSLVLYIANSFRLNYISSKYFTLLDILKSRFVYYFIGYLCVVRLGFFAYSDFTLYNGLKVLRLILFITFIAIFILNSIYKKIDLSFVLGAIIITLFSFEVVGIVDLVKSNEFYIFMLISRLLDYIILVLIATPYYIFNGIHSIRLMNK